MSQTKAQLVDGFNINTSVPANSLVIDSSGNVGIGTSSPSSTLDVEGIVTAKSGAFDLGGFLNKYGADTNSRSWWLKSDTHGYGDFAIRQSTTQTGSSYDTKLLIDSSGNVGIGTTSPGQKLVVKDTSAASTSTYVNVISGNTGNAGIIFGDSDADSRAGVLYNNDDEALRFFKSGFSEAARIDSSGRLLVGTSTSPSSGAGNDAIFLVQGYRSNPTLHAIMSLQRGEGAASITSGEEIANINFGDSAGNSFAWIQAFADANAGSGDYPGRLVFSTTADGASSPTERMRITSDGSLFLYTLSGSVSAMANIKYDTSTKEVYYDTSSRLAKENIADLKHGLDAVKAIQPRTYTAIGGDPNQEIIGFIADELVSVVPEAVFSGVKSAITGNDEDTEIIPLGISYDSLIPVLVKALQEATAKIETLEARLTAAGIE